MSNKPMIDIIVPHYNEPWEVGRKFFLMLSMQRNVDISKVRVIIVQDGKEGALDWANIFASCPYDVQVVTLDKHSGIPAARNAGIKHATADWIMFCDFDDMFSDVYSLSMILDVLPTNEADLLWMSCYHEQKKKASNNFIHCVDENFTTTFGKLYRTSFLHTRNVYFNPKLVSDYEIDFNTLALAELSPNRVFKITTKFNMYVKTFRPGSHFMNRNLVAPRIEDIFYGDMYLVNEFTERNMDHDYRMAVAGAVYDAYFILNSKPHVPHYDEIYNRFSEFYSMNRDVFKRISPTEKEIVLANSVNRMIVIVQNLYSDFRIEAETPPENEESIMRWLDTLTVKPKNEPKQWIDTIDNPKPETHHDDKVVVYCGTRNTYENIHASIKSLLSHTNVDRVFILIEDDAFPYVLPDCVTTMNVSNQTYFRKDGPNYNNAWSYMCMMRAAFHDIFQQYDKILSLDIDIVIEKDISPLWDIDLSGYYLAGVHEPVRKNPDYINFGVVMMNLQRLRQDNVGNTVCDMLNTSKQQCPEQDAFNSACTGHILLLPPEYNYTPFSNITPETDDPAIIHYAGISYWKNFSPVRKYTSLSWDDILFPHPDTHQKHVAVYCGTRDTYKTMVASAKSLLCNSHIDHVYFLIEDDTFPEPLPDYISCINVSNQSFFPKSGANYDNEWTYMVLMRAALTKLLPDLDVVLSLDNDTIVHDSIDDIWNTDLSNSFFAAVREQPQDNHHDIKQYYNFGVVLFNLRKLRSSGMDDQVINSLNSVRYQYNEQECMNKLCADAITPLPLEYNASEVTGQSQHERIHHYCGAPVNKFQFKKDLKLYQNLSWDDVEQIRKEL